MNPHLTIGDRSFEKIHLIDYASSEAGLCGLLSSVLNGVHLSLERNCLPVVYLRPGINDYYYDPERGDNVFEYYFDPVMELGYERACKLVKDGQISPELIDRYSRQEADYFVNTYLLGTPLLANFWGANRPDNPAEWMQEKRRIGREYVGRYLKVKDHLATKVDAFYAQHIAPHYTIGVHIRGTDFGYAQPTAPQTYFDAIRKLVSERHQPDFRIFLATDQVQFADAFENEFPGRVIRYSEILSDNNMAPFQLPDANPYLKGEEVLMDILLLSRCNHVMKCASAVGEYALWFNPELECTDFAVDSHADTDHVFDAYTLLNLGEMSPARLRLVLQYKKAKRKVLDGAISLGRNVLPEKLRDWLWIKAGRHLYFFK